MDSEILGACPDDDDVRVVMVCTSVVSCEGVESVCVRSDGCVSGHHHPSVRVYVDWGQPTHIKRVDRTCKVYLTFRP